MECFVFFFTIIKGEPQHPASVTWEMYLNLWYSTSSSAQNDPLTRRLSSRVQQNHHLMLWGWTACQLLPEPQRVSTAFWKPSIFEAEEVSLKMTVDEIRLITDCEAHNLFHWYHSSPHVPEQRKKCPRSEGSLLSRLRPGCRFYSDLSSDWAHVGLVAPERRIFLKWGKSQSYHAVKDQETTKNISY